MSAPAGWYPDPDTGAQRYWDGTRWAETPTAGGAVIPRRAVAIITVAILAVIGTVLGVYFHGQGHDSGSDGKVNANDLSVQIVYTLSGTATSADITYSLGGSGGSDQQQGIDVPLVNAKTGRPGIRFTAQLGDFLYFSAQNDGDGSLTCTITEDGEVVDTHLAEGSFAIATCTGSA